MISKYTVERNVQILIYLLKANGIRKIVASPGTANMTFNISLQVDDFFEIVSAPDERSAAYVACGLAQESGEAVVLTCTGATASRNYLPGLTEAYYRKLPILAVTGTLSRSKIGNLQPQVIDRTCLPNDTVKLSVLAKWIKDKEDEAECNLNINKALITLKTQNMPVHIDLETRVSLDFSVEELPVSRQIKLYRETDNFPNMEFKKIGIFIGSHKVWKDEEVKAFRNFCNNYDVGIIADHTANCAELSGQTSSLLAFQKYAHSSIFHFDLLIHIGGISGDYYSMGKIIADSVWRVSPDGEISDKFGTLRAVFQVSECQFFNYYTEMGINIRETPKLNNILRSYNLSIPSEDIPFSNIWIAYNLAPKIPEKSILYLGILNTLRSWNFVKIPNNVTVYSNVGGFGIDGTISSALGTALASKEKQVYCILGDLAFFYDMNTLGNRHLPNNLKILLIQNGKGVEFTNYTHPASAFGEDADKFIAAAGHYGNKSKELVKDYVSDLGIEYIAAYSKEEFSQKADMFISSNKPILFECFIDSKDESDALKALSLLIEPDMKDKAKSLVRSTLGDSAVKFIGKIINK